MKNSKKIALGIAFALVVFAGCTSEEEKTQAVTEQVKKTDETQKESTVDDVTKKAQEVSKDIQESAQPIIEQASQKVKEVETTIRNTSVDDLKNAATNAVAPVVENIKEAVSTTPDGSKLYAKCISCHGQNGEKVALGKSQIIQGWDENKIYTSLKGYQDGTYGGAMQGVMKAQVSNMSDSELRALAKHITSL
jgi:cytochrome c553